MVSRSETRCCRLCGCVNDRASNGGESSWVEKNLCSTCAGTRKIILTITENPFQVSLDFDPPTAKDEERSLRTLLGSTALRAVYDEMWILGIPGGWGYSRDVNVTTDHIIGEGHTTGEKA